MFDMSWGEMLIIGAVALIVIGPKDLPKALRTVGNMVGKVRRMAGEFQGQFQEAMREAELDAVRKDLDGLNKSVTSFDPVGTIRDEIKGAVDKGPEASASPSAIAAASDNAAYIGTDVPPVVTASEFPETGAPGTRASIVDTPEVDVPHPEPAPVIDIAKDFAPPASVEAEPLPEPEPRRAKA